MKKSIFIFLILIITLLFSSCKTRKHKKIKINDNDLIFSEFYIPEDDDASWVDTVISELDIESSLDEYNDYLEIEKLLSSSTGKNLNDSDKEKEQTLLDTNNFLKIYQFDTEVFIPSKNAENNNLVTINKCKDLVIRKYYDSNYRLCNCEYWIIKSLNDSKIQIEKKYYYSADNVKPYMLSTESEKNRLVVNYDSDGNIIESKNYELSGKKEILFEQQYFSYDSDGNVIENTIINYKDNIASEKKYIYSYRKDEEDFPDFEYYENSELRKKRTYSSKSNYVEQINIDSDYSVITYYEKYVKVKEIYYLKDEVIREKIYEQ